jgi:hypothetical protein
MATVDKVPDILMKDDDDVINMRQAHKSNRQTNPPSPRLDEKPAVGMDHPVSAPTPFQDQYTSMNPALGNMMTGQMPYAGMMPNQMLHGGSMVSSQMLQGGMASGQMMPGNMMLGQVMGNMMPGQLMPGQVGNMMMPSQVGNMMMPMNMMPMNNYGYPLMYSALPQVLYPSQHRNKRRRDSDDSDSNPTDGESSPPLSVDYPTMLEWLRTLTDNPIRGRDQDYTGFAENLAAHGIIRLDDLTRFRDEDLSKLIGMNLGTAKRLLEWAGVDRATLYARARKSRKLRG